MALIWPNKDPDERLDFTVDWTRYLDNFGSPLTIASVQWKIISGTTESSALSAGNTFDESGAVVATALGITVENIVNTTTTATLVLSPSSANKEYRFVCEITTSSSAQTSAAIVTKRVIHLNVKERV
jgi:hypothetical protein